VKSILRKKPDEDQCALGRQKARNGTKLAVNLAEKAATVRGMERR
jgi:hypothetical protein